MQIAEHYLTRSHCSKTSIEFDNARPIDAEFSAVGDSDPVAHRGAIPSDLGWSVCGKILSIQQRGMRVVTTMDLGFNERKSLLSSNPSIAATMRTLEIFYIWKVREAIFDHDGDCKARYEAIVGWREDKKQVTFVADLSQMSNSTESRFGRFPKDLAAVFSRDLGLMCGINVLIPAYWTISMRLHQGPRFLLSTTPVLVRELLALRDIPEEKKRRDSLLHWVSAHERTRRSDLKTNEEATVDVRRYLRGSRVCHCGEINFEITEASKTLREVVESIRPKC
jgi:hypothetical protein